MTISKADAGCYIFYNIPDVTVVCVFVYFVLCFDSLGSPSCKLLLKYAALWYLSIQMLGHFIYLTASYFSDYDFIC